MTSNSDDIQAAGSDTRPLMLDRTDYESWSQRIRLYYNEVGHIARNYTQPKRPQNSDYFKDKMLLMQAQENGAVLDEEELLFLAGEQGNTFDADMDNQPVQDLCSMNVTLLIQMLMMNRLLSQYSWPICPQSGQQIHKLVHPMHQSYLRYIL
ncbi:hypothetical protein Tco_0961763 [Tanacetum coccineum]